MRRSAIVLCTLYHRAARAVRRSPADAVLGLAAVAVAVYAVVSPFASARYPAMTDLPFHAAHIGAIRHYLDPSYHIREQFELRPFAVPYMSMYAIGAALMWVFPMIVAVKIAAAVMLGLVPAGLAVLFHGMKKSPLLGLLGLGVAWCPLTQWGFLNHMGALGLFAMAVGLTAMLVDRPTRARQAALTLCLVALFFTHIFRYPFALAAVVCTAIVLYPATRRLSPIVLPLVPAALLFLAWLRARPVSLEAPMGPLTVHIDRLRADFPLLTGSFNDPAEVNAARLLVRVVFGALCACMAAAAFRTLVGARGPSLAWSLGAVLAPLGCAVVFLGLFLVLPEQVGTWWYVYPREATSTLLLLLGAFPDLPRSTWWKAPIVAALAVGGLAVSQVVAHNYAKFDLVTADFDAIKARIPRAPRLLYLIFDHDGSTRVVTPFIHLPAYVQAEKGGFLSFHFAVFGASPLKYRDMREPGAVVPPWPPVQRWEWRPEAFDATRDAGFYDWFLVRKRRDSSGAFRADPGIEFVAHQGMWWLFRRRPAPDPALLGH
jgi:hypothetical protein